VNLKIDRAELRLRARELVRLDDAAGTRVHCICGSLWVTQDGDSNDYHLGPGMSFVVNRPGTTLMHALRASEIVLTVPARAARNAPFPVTGRLSGATA